ncbi:SRPBCC domain-containing protein [Flavobacterium sp. LS1R49]|uniref:SRPBCC domain-containing protein n=1 Tax=Flavobacterium shii TaxID=2987687 RepID=A0A9X3C6U1_9FLAO|nr:SRPBCC domain-containing protein [Flavobacterium shii]MCV9927223.1 SRPBCC domain-containing protein [Flavobacterium shii]
MATQLTINNTIEINAPAHKVWDALTNPKKTKIYMFGCEALSDWKVGSKLLWQGNYEGTDIIFVKGNIVSIEPNKKLIYSTFDPNSTIVDIPENYLNVTYELAENNGKTILNVSQGDYSKVADGQRRYCEGLNNGEGWSPILVEIKKLVEEN